MPETIDPEATPAELEAEGVYELEVGSDETTWGRVYADDAGQFNFSGPHADRVEELTRFYAEMYARHLDEFSAEETELTPHAVLAFMDARLNGRTWARVPGANGEEPPTDDDPEGDDEDEDSTPLEPKGEVQVKESFTPAPGPEWEEATFNEVIHAPAGSPKGGQFVSQGGGGRGAGKDGHKPKGTRERAKVGGRDVTLEHHGDGSATVVDGPEGLRGKTIRKKAPAPPAPAKADAPKPDPKPAAKSAAPTKPKTEIKSAEDAEAHFEREHKTKLKNGGLPEAKFLEQSKAVDAEMTRMKDEFKAVADTIKKRPSSGRELVLGEDFASETGSAAGAASAYKFGHGVRIGKDAAFDPKAAPKFGGHTVGEDAGSQFRHEFGHEVYNEGFNGAKRASWEKAAGKFVGTSTVSRYGGTNPSELFSESFSAYTSPNYRRGSLPPEIEGWLDKNVRDEKKVPTANRWETRDDGRLVLNGRKVAQPRVPAGSEHGGEFASAVHPVVSDFLKPGAEFGDAGAYIQHKKTGKIYGPFKDSYAARGLLGILSGGTRNPQIEARENPSAPINPGDFMVKGDFSKGELEGNYDLKKVKGKLSDLKPHETYADPTKYDPGFLFKHFGDKAGYQ